MKLLTQKNTGIGTAGETYCINGATYSRILNRMGLVFAVCIFDFNWYGYGK